jgi:hypothetical protein
MNMTYLWLAVNTLLFTCPYRHESHRSKLGRVHTQS